MLVPEFFFWISWSVRKKTHLELNVGSFIIDRDDRNTALSVFEWVLRTETTNNFDVVSRHYILQIKTSGEEGKKREREKKEYAPQKRGREALRVLNQQGYSNCDILFVLCLQLCIVSLYRNDQVLLVPLIQPPGRRNLKRRESLSSEDGSPTPDCELSMRNLVTMSL